MVSQAVIVGITSYTQESDQPNEPTIGASAREYVRMLARDSWWRKNAELTVLGLPETDLDIPVDAFKNQEWCAEVTRPESVLEPIRRAAARSQSRDGRFLVVYIGHGLHWPDTPGVLFSIGNSHRDKPETWIRDADLYYAVRRAKAKLKVLIADCCYSNELNKLGAGTSGPVTNLIARQGQGTYLFTATSQNQPGADAKSCPSLPAPFNECTSYSGHLLNLLHAGVSNQGPELTCSVIHDKVKQSVVECGHDAEPGGIPNGAERVPLFDNAAKDVPFERTDEYALGRRKGSEVDNWVQRLEETPDIAQVSLSDLAAKPRVAAAVISELLDLATRETVGHAVRSDYIQKLYLGILDCLDRSVDVVDYMGAIFLGDGADGRAERDLMSVTFRALATRSPNDFGQILDRLHEAKHAPFALRALHEYARWHDVSGLAGLASELPPHNRAVTLAAAALTRPVAEAVLLTIEQFDIDQEVAKGVVHDIARQRTVLDVAEFIKELNQQDKPELVTETLEQFTGPGRTNFDKAQLYVLLTDAKLVDQAEILLLLTLDCLVTRYRNDAQNASGETPVVTDLQDDLAAAFAHFNPHGRILVQWVERASRNDQQDIADRIAAILRNDRGKSLIMRELAIGMFPTEITRVYNKLVGQGANKASEKFRGEVAGRESSPSNYTGVEHVIAEWSRRIHEDINLLLRQVVAPPALSGSPRSLVDLTQIDTRLREMGCDREADELLVLAAGRVTGRTGQEIVTLFGRARSKRLRTRLERVIGEGMASAVLGEQETCAWFVECVNRLSSAGGADVVEIARRELSGPKEYTPRTAEIVASAALLMKRSNSPKDEGFRILVRFLLNEQRVSPVEVVRVWRVVRDLFDMQLLYKATVARWSDVLLREETTKALRAAIPE